MYESSLRDLIAIQIQGDSVSNCPACYEFTKFSKFGYKKDDQQPYVRCGSCKTLHLEPMPDAQQLLNYYKALSEIGSYTHEASTFRNKSIEDFLTRCYPSIKNSRWLDYGCFDGYLITQVQKQGHMGFGVEIQEESRRVAQLVASGEVVDALGSTDLPVFNVISMKDSIEHLTDPNSVFLDMLKVSQTGTQLFIQTPNATSFIARLTGKKWMCLNSPEHTVIFSEKGLRLFLQRHGWTLINTKRITKSLELGYVLNQLRYFGGFQSLVKYFASLIPLFLQEKSFTFSGGEFFVYAVKN